MDVMWMLCGALWRNEDVMWSNMDPEMSRKFQFSLFTPKSGSEQFYLSFLLSRTPRFLSLKLIDVYPEMSRKFQFSLFTPKSCMKMKNEK